MSSTVSKWKSLVLLGVFFGFQRVFKVIAQQMLTVTHAIRARKEMGQAEHRF